MTDQASMIYGASGYTGTLIAEEARRQGLQPVLAGDLAGALTPAQAFGADFVLSIPGSTREETQISG
jgi:short subunit dehydrogenase-like uncharacterized protein